MAWRFMTCLLIGLLALPMSGLATEVEVIGVSPGRSATLAIDGGPATTLSVGQSTGPVTLLRVDRAGAVLSVDGITQTLTLGKTRVSSSGGSRGSAITLAADPHGQFYASGAVNGQSVRFLVDTGASLTTLSRKHAQKIGLRYRHGAQTFASTANGIVKGWHISLDSVRVGEVTVRDVEAMIIDNDALGGVALLGMSCLNRFDMQHQAGSLVLRQRF